MVLFVLLGFKPTGVESTAKVKFVLLLCWTKASRQCLSGGETECMYWKDSPIL